jgi:Ca2+-binding EF-hand superfamily protein
VYTAKAVWVGLVLCAATATGAPAQQQKQAPQPINFVELFLQLDTNNDTVIDLDEVPESGRAAYKKLLELGDTDKNGRLEVAELRALGEKVRRSGLIPNFTPQQRFQLLDKNGDGKVTREEFLGAAEVFDRLDTDKDGVLTLDEFSKAPPGAGFGGAGGFQALLRERLKSMDKDGDGKVTREEFQGQPELFDRLDVNKDGVLSAADNPATAPGAATEPAKTEAKKKGEAAKTDAPKPGAGQFGPRLREMDKDGDGKITREEFQGPEANFDRIDLNKDGVLTPGEVVRAAAAAAAKRFQMMDKDGDGKLTREEFPGAAALFDRLDTDHDGFLSKDEAAKLQGAGGGAAAAKTKTKP